MSLVHAEYLKVTRRRLYPTMVAILLLLVAVTAFFLLVFGRVAPEFAADLPVVPKPDAYLLGAQQVAGQTWFPLILAVVMLGGELTTTAWATALTREPRRWAHLLARLVVMGLASWLAFLAGTAAWSAIAAVGASGSGTLPPGEWLGVIFRSGAIALAWTSLGLGAVSVLRSIGPAIGVVLAFGFGEGILTFWEPYEQISLTAATTGLFDVGLDGPFGAFIPGAGMGTAHALAVVAGWTLLGLALGWLGLQGREA